MREKKPEARNEVFKTLTGFKTLSALLLSIFLFSIAPISKNITNQPRFFLLKEELSKANSEEDILVFSQTDSLISHQLKLVSDSNNQPLYFYAFVNTPVCIDNVCKPVDIYLYWNLLGNYAGYGLKKDFPLTKFDHDEFLPEDYQKLHQLLQNEHSILERKTLEDLFDPNAKPQKQVTYQGKEIDAVSGATKAEIKSSVVEGALYSCYTLWHLTHGVVKDRIDDYLANHYSPTLSHSFLYSEYQDYQFYALKKLNETELNAEFTQIVNVFRSSKPLIRTYILKKLPQSIWGKQEMNQLLFDAFEDVDINTRTLLLKKLPLAEGNAFESMSDHIEKMSRNQLKIYLAFLRTNKEKLSTNFLSNLKVPAESQTFAYGYLVQEFLDEF